MAFLKEALVAFPFRVTHPLTDRGSCFTADGFELACRALGEEPRKTKPSTPKTNGMVERFNGRVQGEMPCVTIHRHHATRNACRRAPTRPTMAGRRQRVLDGRSPEQSVRERLAGTKQLVKPSDESRPPIPAFRPERSRWSKPPRRSPNRTVRLRVR